MSNWPAWPLPRIFAAYCGGSRGIIELADPFAATFQRINREADIPFISHTSGEVSFFSEILRELGIVFVLVRTYQNSEWGWEKGSAYEPQYAIDKIDAESMREFLRFDSRHIKH